MEGNKKDVGQRYLKEKVDILIKYLLKHNIDELTAYASQIRLYTIDSYQVYRRLAYDLSMVKVNDDGINGIMQLGNKLDKYSYSILDKLFSNSIKVTAANCTKRNGIKDALTIERKKILALLDSVKLINGKKKLLHYLMLMRDVGEFSAIKCISQAYSY